MIRQLAGDLGPIEVLAHDMSHRKVKAVTIIHVPAIVKTKRLLVKVAEKVEWFHTHVRSTYAAPQLAPQVLQVVRVYRRV